MPLLVNAYSTLRNPPEPEFPHVLHSRRDITDPEMPDHLEGFCGFAFQQGGGEMTQQIFHVIQHIERVKHQFSFEVEDDVLDAMADWGVRANAIMFLHYGAITDPFGRELIAPPGTPVEGIVPYPQDALDRKQRTEAALSKRGVKVPASLPPSVSEGEVDLRDANEVAHRCLALAAVAVRGESLNSGEPLGADELRGRLSGFEDHLSPAEREFMNAKAPSQQDVVQFTWRYEALNLLLWALGKISELPDAGGICDVPAVVGAVLDADPVLWASAAELRPTSEIIDALDMTYRQHWAVRQAGLDGAEPPGGLDGGVVMERHHALNWLTRFQSEDWDNVDTPT